MSNIQDKIQEELENARAVCSTEGATSGECAAAWDAVEELQAEAAHQRHTASTTPPADDTPSPPLCCSRHIRA